MLVAISTIKNSADMIETMIRGNARLVDRFIFMDHNSTDRTVEIIRQLKEEGLPVELVAADDKPEFVQDERMNYLLRYACEKYAPDFILPMDDDEILCSKNGDMTTEQLRTAINGLSRERIYYIKWRIYIPTEEDDPQEFSPALRQKYCFDEEPETAMKVMIPAALVSEDMHIAFGNHTVTGERIRERMCLEDLRLAHYPVRSAAQIASKALVGWINNLTDPDHKEGVSYHWERMYQSIKRGGLPSVEMMQAMTTLYRQHPNDEEHLNVVKRPLDIPRELLQLRYTTGREVNVMGNLCGSMEFLAEEYVKMHGKPEKEA